MTAIAAAVLIVCGLVKGWPRAQAKNADEAIPAPEMIGEGIISTDEDELGGGVTPDSKTLIFEKSAAPHYLYIMCESHLVNGAWSKPKILPFSRQYRDTDPVLAPDGGWILFCFGPPGEWKRLASMVDLASTQNGDGMGRTETCAGGGE